MPPKGIRIQPLPASPRRSTAPAHRLFLVILFVLILFVLDVACRLFLPDGNGAAILPTSAVDAEIFQSDAYGMVRPFLERTFPSADEKLILLNTNRYGMRQGEVELVKPSGTVRIAVLGDSISFGWRLPEEPCYPRVLERMLNASGGRHYEVLNFSAPAYTSFHGQKQYERLVHNFQPDLLVLAFGLYDSFEARYSEPEYYHWLEESGLNQEWGTIPRLFHDFSTIGHWIIQHRQKQRVARIRQICEERKKNQFWTPKVKPEDLQQSLHLIMQHQAGQKGKSLLVNLNLLNYWNENALHALQTEDRVSLMDFRPVVDQLGGVEERKKRFELNLDTEGNIPRKSGVGYAVRFRLFVPNSQGNGHRVFVMGNHPALGDMKPGQVDLYDDGSHGDEKANDRVWSREIEFAQPATLYYTFLDEKATRQWVGVPDEDEHAVKNNLHYQKIDHAQFKEGECFVTLVTIFSHVPYEDLLLPDSPCALPNAALHTSIATRLARLIQEMKF